MPGAEEVNRITARNTKYVVTIDMSDVFFALPIAPESRECTACSWEGTEYQSRRLPQGYRSSPVTAHTLPTSQIDVTKYESFIISCIDAIIVMHGVPEPKKGKR